MPTKYAPLDSITYENFKELLHSKFQVQGSAGSVELELIEANGKPAEAVKTQLPVGNFSLLFAGPTNSFLPQQTYQFTHEKLGTFDLFIVPIGKDQNGYRYQAIFNRSVRT